VPPTTIRADGTLIKRAIPPPMKMAAITRPKEDITPNNVAMSINPPNN
jgi:hypothetical protein